MQVKLTSNQLIGATAHDKDEVVEVSEAKGKTLLKAKAAVPYTGASVRREPDGSSAGDEAEDDKEARAKASKGKGRGKKEQATDDPDSESADAP